MRSTGLLIFLLSRVLVSVRSSAIRRARISKTGAIRTQHMPAASQDEQAVAEAMLLPRLQAIQEHAAVLELNLQRLAAPTIRNGDFESEQRPNDEYFMVMSRDGQVGSACSLTGWNCTHSLKGVFLSRGGNDGLNCVALRSGGASISQTLTGLTTGQTYRLTYLASNRQRFLKKSDLKTTVTSGRNKFATRITPIPTY